MQNWTKWISGPWIETGRDLLAAFGSCLGGSRRPGILLALLVLTTTLAWFLYVPLHEFLHLLGCIATGGRVEKLEISPLFGGRLWAKLLPFVEAGRGYAGRLARFDTQGSDLTYLCTDLAPYLLTVLGGVALLRRASATRNPLALAAGAVLAAAPLLSLTGDYYEMGSVIVSRVLTRWPGGPDLAVSAGLRHDDLFALMVDLPRRFPRDRILWGVAVGVSFLCGVLLAGLTLELSRRCGRWLAGPEPRSGESELLQLPPQR